MQGNQHIATVQEVRAWIKSLDERPGVYLIENVENRACYVGSSRKSLRQRLLGTLSYLIGKRHHAALLQADWQFYGAESFAWWATYSISDKEALEDEKRLVMLANAFEDFGGYCQRTNGNCIGACIRDTELKLMRSGLFEYLPTTRVEARFSDVWIKTFCQGNTLLAQSLRHACRFAKGKRAQAARERQLAAWKSTSTMHVSASKRGVSECR